MAFAINTNVASLQAQNSLRVTGDLQSKTINRVTSGLRIVASGDDAAGLAIANTYRSDGAVLAQGVRNANDGLSQLQTADGGINNISQLLDRARTLATQSASGAFTGDRSVLNSEFQSVVTEIDRQAQAVGLNTGGQFAKALSVFIGGGQSSNGISATTNGSVSLDLSRSTVDSASLGLKGVQATGVAGTDIGSGSPSTSLSALLANSTNTASAATPGFTTFVVKGPGFDGNGVTLSVNTANLGGTSDLAAKVNAAISAAANGGTQEATALKNANVLASINTDSNGKQQLVFKSSTTAFQVQAGDRLANALLGNFERNASVTASDTAAYADTSVNNTLSFKIDGGSTISVSTITSSVGTSKGQIVKDLNADATFGAAATASLNGNQIVIKSKGNSATSSVEVVSTALGTAVGLTAGTTSAASASTGAALNVQNQGVGTLNARANIIGTDTNATRSVTSTTNKVKVTVNGTAATLTLTQGTTLTKGQLVSDINTQIAASGVTGLVTAKLKDNQVVFEATKQGQTLSLDTIANDAYTALGITADTSSTSHKAIASDTITLRFSGSGLTSPVDISLNTLTAGTTTTADVLADLQTKISNSSDLNGAGITLTTSSVGNNLVFTSSKGEQFQVTATGDSENVLGLGSFLSGANSAVDYTTITAGSAYSTSGAGGTASFEVSLNGEASSSNTFSANLSGGDAAAATRTSTVVYTSGVVDLTGGANLVLRVNGGSNITVALGASATTSIAGILGAINSASTTAGYGNIASLNGSGNLVLTSNTKGSNSSVEVVNVAGGSDAETLTALGLGAGGLVSNGTNATEANVIQQLNDSIAADAELVKAGLKATDDGGKIVLSSSNGTYFRLNASGAGDAGFTHSGATFAGNTQGAAPATSHYFDSQGADASTTLAYSDRLYGSDDQTISISANDANGVKHALSVNLQNDTTARSQSIYQALHSINSALQQSNDSTLNRVVAVKEESGGVQSIRFLSTVRGFQVTVGSDPNGTGITPPTGNQSTATTVGTGANADIGDVASAQSAVAALADAVSLLGKAQAVVGRGQNQFAFAINLAQSQLTNLAAAESRIRDADLAAESANLTKSQILLQAGIAALAQANSAPQQVLSLLRG
ncbi:MAG: flagellin [Bryobacteraceae bacterium]